MTTIPTTIQEHIPLALPGLPPAATGKGLSPTDILAILKQKLVVIIMLWIVFAGLGVGLFFLLWFKFPRYPAEALIECISDAPGKSLTLEQTRLPEDTYLRFIQSQAMFLKSYTVLSDALKDSDVRETQWFQSVPQDERYVELEKELGCSAVRDTTFLRVSMATHSSKDPHRIVNAIVRIYLAKVRDQGAEPFRQELKDYKDELASVRTQIQQKRDQIQAHQATINPGETRTGTSQQLSPMVQNMINLQAKVSELELQTAEFQGLKETYTDPSGQYVMPVDRLQVEQDMQVAQLNSQVSALQQELNVVAARLGPNHREAQEMRTRLDETQRQLDIARSTRLREILEEKREQVSTAYYNSVHARDLAQERLMEAQAQQADLDRKLAEHDTLKQELDLLVELQNRIQDYIRDVERIVKERAAVRVTKAVDAHAPEERSFPSLYMLPAAIILALAMSLGLAVGLELIDTSLKTPLDIVRHLSVAMLGTIPDTADDEVEIEYAERAVLDAPHSMVTEAFRTVRSNLQFSAPAERMRSILVTSPKPEHGKTTVAVNLAASIAVGGRRVLLVDANLRRPALRRVFPQIGEQGVTNLLVGTAKLADCITTTQLPNLDVVGSGPVPPNPADLVGSELFRSFLREASEKYDHVVLDSPPILLASDASVISTLVDGTILVCRAKTDSRGVAQRACSLLQHVNAHLFGAVLNGAQVRRGGYFREQLRTFYEYQTEGELTADRTPALPDRSADGPPDKTA
jgi:polysaccharide biosynthesis transport protein